MATKGTGFKEITRVSATGSDNLFDPLSMFVSAKQEEVEEEKVEVKQAPVGPQFTETFRMPNFALQQQRAQSITEFAKDATSMISSMVSDFVGVSPASPAPLVQPANIPYQSRPAGYGGNNPVGSVPIVQGTPAVSSITPPAGRDETPQNMFQAENNEILLAGENMVMELKDVYIHVGPARAIPGVLLMTNFRFKFITSPAHLNLLISINPAVVSWMNIPLACIDRIEKEKKTGKEAISRGVVVTITCKDVRQLRFSISSKSGSDDYETDRALSTMIAYTFPNNIKHLFAFYHCLPSSPAYLSLLEPFDIQLEYIRLGILDGNKTMAANSPWRMSNANREYRLCKTYARALVMPVRMTDEELYAVAAFRSGQRLPVMCWGDKETGATMWRSSQPKAGVSGSCVYDERFLDNLAQSCAFHRTPLGGKRAAEAGAVLHIVDCRPRASAMANKAAGAGYESQTNYPNSRLEFYNIPNIHVMRDSYRSLTNVVLAPAGNGELTFSKSIEDTQWLYYTRLVLKASWETANFIRKGQPVLVHCSHGWDRTAQVCSLAQLFLDSYYRTMEGFRVLVEKEWCSFGHPFQLRCQHGMDKSMRQDDQFSPIFLQFLDCVYQIQRQNKQYFEFNSRYLVALADQYYAGRFGTFLLNCDFDRETLRSRDCCVDVWTYLYHNRHIFLNPCFQDPNLEDTPTTHVLLPQQQLLLRNVVLWGDYFLRYGGLSSMLVAPEPLTKWLMDCNGMCQPAIPTSEVIKIHPSYREDSERGTLLDEAGRRCVDLEIPAIVTAEDFWEAAYREERSKREELEAAIRLLCMDHNIEGAATKTPMELNEMLKEKLHRQPQSSSTHVHHKKGSIAASDSDNYLPGAEFDNNNNNNNSSSNNNDNSNDSDNAMPESLPSPPPSPPASLEAAEEGEGEIADAEMSYAAPGFASDPLNSSSSSNNSSSRSRMMGTGMTEDGYYDVDISNEHNNANTPRNANKSMPQSWISPVSTPATSTSTASAGRSAAASNSCRNNEFLL